MLNNIDLTKPIEKLFIKTLGESYSIEGKTIKCWIEAYFCVRYKSGQTQYLSYTIGKGKAVCSPEDKFDANIGLKLAATRAEIDYCKGFSKFLGEANKVIADYDLELVNLILDCNNQVMHNRDYISKLIEE